MRKTSHSAHGPPRARVRRPSGGGRPVVLRHRHHHGGLHAHLRAEGHRGAMFIPMAFTVVAAILGSLLLALTFVPAAASGVFRQRQGGGHAGLRPVARRLLPSAARPGPSTRPAGPWSAWPWSSSSARSAAPAAWARSSCPGSTRAACWCRRIRLPSTALDQGTRFSTALGAGPARASRGRGGGLQAGPPDLATEAMGTYESDTYVMLKPNGEWRPGGKDALLTAMDSALRGVPGIWTTPSPSPSRCAWTKPRRGSPPTWA